MDLHNISRISSVGGHTLNVEETAGLEAAMSQRRLDENLTGKVQFWGKIFGATQDYLIVQCVDLYGDFPDKKYYYCTTSDYLLRALPDLSTKKEYETIAEGISVRFTGDPSFFAYNGEEPEEVDPEAPPVERFRELHRLSYVVKKIEHDCFLVPSGALVVDASKRVIFNPYYNGLSYQTSSDTRAYFHLRRPENLQAIALLKKPGFVKPGDFLDSILKDTPSEMWNIALNNQGTVSSVRNFYWEGYQFYSVVGTSEYGNAYFGIGVPNPDLAFMF